MNGYCIGVRVLTFGIDSMSTDNSCCRNMKQLHAWDTRSVVGKQKAIPFLRLLLICDSLEVVDREAERSIRSSSVDRSMWPTA